MGVNLVVICRSVHTLFRVQSLPFNCFLKKNLTLLKQVTFYRPSSQCTNTGFFSLDPPKLDYDYLCNSANFEIIASNIVRRKTAGNIEKVTALFKEVQMLKQEVYNSDSHDSALADKLKSAKLALEAEASKIPNQTHPDVFQNKTDEPVVFKTVGTKRAFKFDVLQFHELAGKMDLLQTDEVSLLVGRKGYYLKRELAELERALVNFTMDRLLNEGFCPFSVPDLLHSAVIEGCGMDTRGKRTQVYHLNTSWGSEVCLSGTAEMALAAYFNGKDITEDQLPCQVAAVSRCYRAEISKGKEEKWIGLYRVHQFTKVEMFGITPNRTGEESNKMLKDFLTLQESLFSELGLHFKVLDMPLSDLGPSAYRKFDIEAWLPGRKIYGEISSASNCTDYQSRRLHIEYQPSSPDGKTGLNKKFAHTVNGTACAVPRMLIAIFETYQNKDGSVTVPKALIPYMHGKDVIKESTDMENVKWFYKKLTKRISNMTM